MITINIGNTSIEAKGHASNNLICNSVSVLMWALATSLAHGDAVNLEVIDSDGYQYINYCPDERLQVVFDGFAESLKQIAENFPEEVSIFSEKGEKSEKAV